MTRACGCCRCDKHEKALQDRLAFLRKKMGVTEEDGALKMEGGDYHGVADAAMDLRDMSNEIDGLTYLDGEAGGVKEPA